MAAALAAVATGRGAYGASTGEAGGRIDDRPGARRGGVAWLRLGAGFAETAALSLAVDDALGSATYDDRHRPRPHLTVARKVDQAVLDSLSAVAPELHLSWTVDRIVLFRSHTGTGGASYEELNSFDLGH